MALAPKQLYQGKPTGTAASILVTTTGKKMVVTSIWLAENAGAVNDVFLYHDADGTTYDATTFLGKWPLAANEVKIIDGVSIALDSTSGNLACKLTTTLQVTVTLYGYEIT